MIQTHYVEIRSRRPPGQAEPTTIIREIHSQNGRGRKTVRVLRGNRVISTVSEPLGLYASAESKTMRKLNPRKKTRRARRLNKRVRK